MAKQDLDKLFESGDDVDALFESGEDVGQAAGEGSDLMDVARGAGQGLSMGFADELYGAAKALPSVLDGKQAFLDKYRQEQKAAEEAYEASKERSPFLTGGAELGGAILSGFATGGLGAGGKAAQGASKLAKIGNLAKGAAIAGAVEGAGKSKGGEGEVLEDILAGGTFGAVTGATLGAGGEIAKGLRGTAAKIAEESPFARQVMKSFELGGEGQRVYSEAQQISRFAKESGKNADELLGKIKEADQLLGSNVQKSVQEAQQNGVVIDIGDDIKRSASDLVNYYNINPSFDMDNKIRGILSKLSDRSISSMGPEELRSYKAFVEESIQKLKGSTTPESNQIRGNLVQLAQDVDAKLKGAIPNYREAARQFSEFRSKFVEPLERRGMPEGFKADRTGSIATRTPGIATGAEKMFATATTPGAGGEAGQRVLGELTEGLEALQQSKNPVAGIFGKPEDFLKETKGKADVSAIYKQTRGLGNVETSGSGLFSNILSLGKNAAFTGANMLGEATPKVLNLDANAMQMLGQKMQQTPAFQHLGNALLDGAANKNQSRINAVVFTLLQKPQGRKLLEDLGIAQDASEDNK